MTKSRSTFSQCEWRLGFGAGSVSQFLYLCVCRRAASTCSTWGRASMKSSKRRKGGIVSWLKSIADLHTHYYTLSTRYSCFPLEFINSVHSVIQILFPVPSKSLSAHWLHNHFSMCWQTGVSLQQRADGWKEKVSESRSSRPRTPTPSDQEAQVTLEWWEWGVNTPCSPTFSCSFRLTAERRHFHNHIMWTDG